jgi:hypothetical protein
MTTVTSPLSAAAAGEPVSYDVDYPDRELDRLTTAFRLIVAIPILLVVCALTAWSGLVVVPTMLMLVGRRKYPRWFYAFNVESLRFQNRVGVYLALMDDRYPSTDEQQSVRLTFPEPDEAQLNRWLPLVKWLLAIPHYLVLAVLYVGAILVVVAAWFAILFTGRFPRALFDYLVGVGRYTNRVLAYAFVLVTDEYPPFRLAA